MNVLVCCWFAVGRNAGKSGRKSATGGNGAHDGDGGTGLSAVGELERAIQGREEP